MIPNGVARGLQASREFPLDISKKPRKQLGAVATGVSLAAERMISAGLRTEEEVFSRDPRGISESKKSEQKKRFHDILVPQGWSSKTS